jgi:hypothetical protein
MNKIIKFIIEGSVVGWGSFLSVVFLFRYNFILTLVLIFISILALILWRSKSNFLLYILCGFGGMVMEAIVVGSGAWTYAFPNFIGIPYFLPFLWGITGIFIKEFSDFLRELLGLFQKS